jgi:hypothetical protein
MPNNPCVTGTKKALKTLMFSMLFLREKEVIRMDVIT